MKIFIYNANDYLENLLCQKLHRLHILYGTLEPTIKSENVYLKHIVPVCISSNIMEFIVLH